MNKFAMLQSCFHHLLKACRWNDEAISSHASSRCARISKRSPSKGYVSKKKMFFLTSMCERDLERGALLAQDKTCRDAQPGA